MTDISELPPALPHRVTWEIETEKLTGSMVCNAQPGALCRVMCAEDCGAEQYPCYSLDDKGERVHHGLVDAGYCNAVTEFENSGEDLELHYDGKPNLALPRHGMAMVKWNGDAWLWRYLDSNEVLSAIMAGVIAPGMGGV